MTLSLLLLECDFERLNLIAMCGESGTHRLLNAGVRVLWNRDGEVRRIPRAVIVQALDTYETWRNVPGRWRVATPRDVGVILWEQTIETRLGRPQP